MPDLTTHYLFGDSVYNDVNEDIKILLDKYKNEFNIGLQGPDILFFHNALNLKISKKSFSLPRIGSKMHTELIDEVLNYMKLYIATLEYPSAEHDILSSYYLGYICHYILDKTVHPYVYYLVDRMKEKLKKETEHSIHIKIESELDVILYEKLKSEHISNFNVKNEMSLSTVSKNVIAKMYSDMIRELFDTQVEVLEIMKSLDDIVNISKLLYNKNSVLEKFSFAVNKILPIAKNLTYHIKPKSVRTDTANLNCRLWHHPLYPEIKSHKSVLGLFYDAKSEAVSVLNELYPLLNSQTPILFDTSLDFHGNKIKNKG